MILAPELRAQIEEIAGRYPDRRSALLPALHLAQRSLGGCVQADGVAEVASILGLPLAAAFGVQSYYTMFNRQPIGRYHLQLDVNVPAMLAGADALLAHLEQVLGIRAGQTTPDGLFTLSTVQDLGSCGTCPVLQVNDRYYENLTPARADELLTHLRRGQMPDWQPEAAWGSSCNILLRRRGNPKARELAEYRKTGGYQALEKALGMTPEALVAEVKAAALRGRGGAGFPAGMKWGFLPKEGNRPVYMICNADEGEPGTFKDRQIMEFDPHLLLEGLTIAGLAVGSRLGFIYIRGEFAWIAEILERAAEQARQAKLLGNDILGRGKEFEVLVHLGAGAYVCGEETALIESLEGKRGCPRVKPPFPASAGLYGCPTIVNNVETLACVPTIVQHGAEAFKKLGTPNNHGPKIFGISGHVKRPGTYEHPLGTSLDALLAEAGGVQGKLKAIIVGGLSVPILTAAEAAGLKMDYDSCLKAGTMLGSGGVIVMNETTSIPAVALRAMEFYAHESCGQCAPCSRGSHTVLALLRRLVAGRGSQADIEAVLHLCKRIKGSTLCPTGDAFSVPIEAMVRKFRPEFEALVR
ncbi:MAG TPA: NADH-quinone oxidoreductase subunit NuoF [Myxococcota bacterium]|nr:NADH-quinone oxidoreductase subunit NuoF [Myxococcota bacterium]HRY95693.1 NADH-quinone oxidoreductase subunit NuoF [Myxococcota bacterium]HSA20191.1 NADH-quinone oxidoreductase subunit NuoF [Myxococcota bacterium]